MATRSRTLLHTAAAATSTTIGTEPRQPRSPGGVCCGAGFLYPSASQNLPPASRAVASTEHSNGNKED
eukprot:CAMPEP_0118971618 /NCGR_PEP_ID=MMETSP1173-20130426/8187_1 /TAXON_ID=1034831 /ORGANISM="Rhizochromulina marina cf, Strain CCMP1243" /LENGTH=67 /DNA_ID=CAMNT_0006921087 /DNA_START=247 /DNA_END=453 /DNA_ORIENTATION=-